MRFLRTLLTCFTRSTLRKTPQFVIEHGGVGRFLFNRRDLFQNGTPKPKAFAPDWHPTLQRFETSVCGLNGVDDERLWHLGKTVRAVSGLSAIAAAEISVATIRSIGLKCNAAPEPGYPEHGVIVGWNSDPESKDARLAAQQELVAAIPASNVRRPSA